MNLKTLGIITAAFAAVVAVSCSNDDTKNTSDEPTLTVTPLLLEAGSEGGDFPVTVETTAPWQAQSNKDFVQLNPSWNVGNATLTVTIEKNRTAQTRDAVVTVMVEGCSPIQLPVYQDAGIEETVGARKFYVTPDGSADNSGLTWSEATTFEKAFNEVVAGEEIHLAAGIYTPTEFLTSSDTADECNKTFEINKNITLIGGYPSDPTTESIADPSVHQTIFSGKISAEKNAYHVMVVSAPLEENHSVKVQGIYIQDGIAVAMSGPTVNGEACQTRNGGGLVVQGATKATFEDCVISNNSALTHDGGGVYLKKATEVRFVRCQIKDNKTEDAGAPAAGICNESSVLYLYDCILENNQSGGNSAAIQAAGGGGITAETYAFNCTFNKNQSGISGSDRIGGGYYSLWTAQAAFVNCTFYENMAIGGLRGGALCVNTGDLDLISCTIYKNNGNQLGGGVQIRESGANVRIYNSVISGNLATTEGMEDIGYDKTESKRAEIYSSVIGSKSYNASGAEDGSTIPFDAATMFGPFTNNGGSTSTIALIGADNPAIIGGMTADELKALVNETLVPIADADLLGMDQTGATRTGRQMGACVK